MKPGEKDTDNKFGEPISTGYAISRWFNQEPFTRKIKVQPVKESWLCPHENCDGEMVANGMTWPVNPPGYHHTCSSCGFTAAINERFPSITYEEMK